MTNTNLTRPLLSTISSLTQLAQDTQKLAGAQGKVPPRPEDVYAQLSDCIVVADSSGCVLHATPLAKQLIPDIRVGKSLHLLNLDIYADTETKVAEWTYQSLNRNLHFEYRVSHIRSQDGHFLYVHLNDVTEKRVEAIKAKVRSQLYCEVAKQASLLVRQPNLYDVKGTLKHLLSEVLNASKATHLWLLENRLNEERIFGHVDLYLAKDKTIELNEPLLLESSFQEVSARLANNQSAYLFVQNLQDAHFKHELEANLCHTLLFVPVYVGDFWWGNVLLAYPSKFDENWYYAEVDPLKMTASLVSSVLCAASKHQAYDLHLMFQQAVFDVLPLPFFSLNENNELVYVNDSLSQLLNAPSENLVGLPSVRVFGAKLTDTLNTATMQPQSVNLTLTVKGKPRKFQLSFLRFADSQQNPHGILGVLLEGCSPKACSPMQDTHDLMARLLQQLDAPVAFLDCNGRVQFTNTAFCQWVGQSESQLIGRVLPELDTLHVSVRQELYQLSFMSMASRDKSTKTVMVDSQTYRVTVSPVYRNEVLLGQMLKVAKVSASEHEVLLESISVGIVSADLNGKILYANPEAKRLFKCQTLAGQMLRDFIAPIYLPQFNRRFDAILTEKRLKTASYQLKASDGTIFSAETSAVLSEVDSQKRIHIVLNEVSQSATSVLHMQSALNLVTQPVIVFDNNSVVVFANEAAKVRFDVADFMGKELTHFGFSEKDLQPMMQLLSKGCAWEGSLASSKPQRPTLIDFWQVKRYAGGDCPFNVAVKLWQ